MTPLELTLRLTAGVLLILTNSFFVAIEFALTRARQFSEQEFIDGTPALERAWEMTNNLEINVRSVIVRSEHGLCSQNHLMRRINRRLRVTLPRFEALPVPALTPRTLQGRLLFL